MQRNRFLVMMALAASVVAVAGSASASSGDSTYDWSFTSGGKVLASGALTTDKTGDVLSMTGDVGSDPISFTPGTGDDGVFLWDNVISASTPHVDNSGLLFQGGGLEWNIYNSLVGTFPNGDTLANSLNNYGGTLGTLNIAAVPEPATWAMLILGVGMIGLAARRRGVMALV